jgi:hypothetical protein
VDDGMADQAVQPAIRGSCTDGEASERPLTITATHAQGAGVKANLNAHEPFSCWRTEPHHNNPA